MIIDIESSGNRPNTIEQWLLRHYTADLAGRPYDAFQWEKRDIVQKHAISGEVIFEQRGVQVPTHWGAQAAQILATKYLRQTSEYPREQGLQTAINRIVGAICDFAVAQGRLNPQEAMVVSDELKYMMVDQRFSFNSPVWFNIGVPGRPQRASACFILDVQDSLDSIYNWVNNEGKIFAGGSGAGVNLSRVRSTAEKLSSGHPATGPVSFMRMADSAAGVIASGASTRKAAKMVVLDVDHPDVQQFIWCKANEGRKARVLEANGFAMGLDDHDMLTLQYQNANNSVRVSDEFMMAVEADEEWELRARTTGEVVRQVSARQLWREIAEAAWECADPGLQYSSTINRWNALADTEEIVATNPCSEFVYINNTACNLASINLLKYYDDETGTFDADEFAHDCQTVLLSMELLVDLSEYPTPEIADNSHRLRPLGLGYTNLGALLMRMGLPYDSDEGREMTAAITALMGGASTVASVQFAQRWGAYEGYAANKRSQLRVLDQHLDAAKQLAGDGTAAGSLAQAVANQAVKLWEQGVVDAKKYGIRNGQTSLIAPTGTISFLMGADTTGVEPDLALSKHKKLVGGGDMKIVNQSVLPALRRLGYNEDDAEIIAQYMRDNNTPIGAPGLDPQHYNVFACAMTTPSISPMGHVAMMGAVQPFLSGAISKTVNMPADSTIEDVAEVYFAAWQAGCKAIAIYRDNSKLAQPLSAVGSATAAASPVVGPPSAGPQRRKLPVSRQAKISKFTVGGLEGYLTVGLYDDGTPGEVFIKTSKQGSTLEGVMDGLAIVMSLGLQHGVPLETYVQKFMHTKFDPAGLTEDPELRMASSVLDYIARRLACDHLPVEVRHALGIKTTAERTQEVTSNVEPVPTEVSSPPPPVSHQSKAAVGTHICSGCGGLMNLHGSCWLCESCGTTSGCS